MCWRLGTSPQTRVRRSTNWLKRNRRMKIPQPAEREGRSAPRDEKLKAVTAFATLCKHAENYRASTIQTKYSLRSYRLAPLRSYTGLRGKLLRWPRQTRTPLDLVKADAPLVWSDTGADLQSAKADALIPQMGSGVSNRRRSSNIKRAKATAPVAGPVRYACRGTTFLNWLTKLRD